ncbi:hypothetical protein [Rhodococcus sp. NPDC049939]|uniref:hypothetical protein n=1 Tax=Rhodococcus sp. NPDC049939 TaxID=3155511 RepID=UPI0033FC5718
MKVFYSPDYIAAKYSFDTTRKSEEVCDSLIDNPIAGVETVEPTPVHASQLALIHDRDYIDAVRTGHPKHLAESQGFAWDEGIWTATTASTGGMVDAALAALEEGVAGTLSSGLHHARRNTGAGFCTFNGLSLAAILARDAGARDVLIVDFDAHGGGGTRSTASDNPHVWQTDIAVSTFDDYDETDRFRYRFVMDPDTYLLECEAALAEVDSLRDPQFDLVLYNAGMDPHEDCDVGGLTGITTEVLAERERMVFEWAKNRDTPIAFTLAGGYANDVLTKERLVDLHRLTISEAAQLD